MENEEEYVSALDDTTEATPDVEETTEEVEQTDEEYVSKADYDKAMEIANNYKIRAEKAEKDKKVEKKPVTQESNLSVQDLYALMDAKVPSEDIDEVTDYAKLKGISITEAVKSNVIKGILKDKQEVRTSANATNTSSARRASSKQSDEALLANAAKGIVPESDKEIRRLIALTQK